MDIVHSQHLAAREVPSDGDLLKLAATLVVN
jgi:hypothetical protein